MLNQVQLQMKWNNKFNYPKSSRSIEGGLRKYLFGEEKLPSVTSVLNATKSEEDKISLELWKKRVGYTEANKIKNEASSRGTSMHSYIEQYLQGRVNLSFFESSEQYKNMAKEIIDKLYERITGGDDFAPIAKSHSDDPVSAIDGGSLDWVSPGQMVPEFDNMMNQVALGEISKPFRSQFGWHILQVTERRKQDMGALIQTNQAKRIIHKHKYEKELSNWLLEIKGEAFIEIKSEIKGLPSAESH